MRATVIAIVLVSLAATTASAEGESTAGTGEEKGTFGLGLIVGEPTGICAKL